MTEKSSKETLEDDICIHIFTVSAAMVGVCLTVIGLFKVVAELKNVSTFGDDLLVIDAMAFLVSCILSYYALRSRGRARKYIVEKIADAIFLAALCLMAIVCGLITYAIV
jgi:hypothetical protein